MKPINSGHGSPRASQNGHTEALRKVLTSTASTTTIQQKMDNSQRQQTLPVILYWPQPTSNEPSLECTTTTPVLSPPHQTTTSRPSSCPTKVHSSLWPWSEAQMKEVMAHDSFPKKDISTQSGLGWWWQGGVQRGHVRSDNIHLENNLRAEESGQRDPHVGPRFC